MEEEIAMKERLVFDDDKPKERNGTNETCTW